MLTWLGNSPLPIWILEHTFLSMQSISGLHNHMLILLCSSQQCLRNQTDKDF